MKLHSRANYFPPVFKLWEAKFYHTDMEIVFFPTSSSCFRSPLHIGNFPSFWNRLTLPLPCDAQTLRKWGICVLLWGRQLCWKRDHPFLSQRKDVRGICTKNSSIRIRIHSNDVFSVHERLTVLFCLSPSHNTRLISGLSLRSHFLLKYQELVPLSGQHVRVAWSSCIFSGGEMLPGAELLWQDKA